jgi:hypothetical protein
MEKEKRRDFQRRKKYFSGRIAKNNSQREKNLA